MLNEGDLKDISRAVRLIDMMNYLSMVRKTTISALCVRYSKGRTTIKDDLKTLEYDLDVPFMNKKGQYIMVYNGWWFGSRYLTEKQKNALRYAIRVVKDKKIEEALISILI